MSNYYDVDKRRGSSGGDVVGSGLQNPYPHINFVPEYQVAGYPAVYEIPASTPPIRIKFPYVTQWIMITNACSSNDVYISFTEAAAIGLKKYEAAGNADVASVAIANQGAANEAFSYTTITAAHKSRMNIKNGAYTQALPIKCSEIFIDNGNQGGCTLMVGLTNILADQMPLLSGSDVG